MQSRQLTVDIPSNDSLAPLLLGLSGSLLTLSILLLCARFWSRLRNLKADDWTVLAGTILAIVNYFIQCIACSHGFGLRSRFVPPPNRRTILRLVFTSQIIWYWSITFVKLSVALLLLRLKPSRPWRFFLHSIMTLLVVTLLAQTLFPFLQCRPFSIYWDPSPFLEHGGVTCIPRSIISANIIANSTIHVTTDLILSVVPITFIRKLHRPRSEKIFLSILMALGLFASTFAVLRTVGLSTFDRDKHDFLRGNVLPTLWATLEQEVAMVAATVPTLRSFGQSVLVRAGTYFYDKENEAQIRGKLVELGFLRTAEEDGSYESFRWGRKLSKPDIEVGRLGLGLGTKKGELGDTVIEKEIDGVDVSGGDAKEMRL